MNTTTAQNVTVGQHIRTAPQLLVGLPSMAAPVGGVVTAVESYEIRGHSFVDITMGALTLMSIRTDCVMEVVA